MDELKEVLRHVDPESIQPELTRMKARGELMRRDLLDKDEVRWTVDGSRNS